jgi:uncharacterized membrane protein
VNIQRVLAVFAAAMFVCAVALATLGGDQKDLGELLSAMDADLLRRLQLFIARWFGDWAWTRAATPLLHRPAWLTPAMLSLLAAGFALSMFGRKSTNRSRRRS